MKSILQSEKVCYLCEGINDLEEHHIFFGTSNRANSEKTGLKVFLCHTCHTIVHHNHKVDLELKEWAQRKYEETHSREEFRQIFGKSWL